MPWCEECSRYLTPSSIRADGTCPTCGRPIPVAEAENVQSDGASARPGTDSSADADDDEKAPWHFKLLVVALVVYLGWRLVQMIGWLI